MNYDPTIFNVKNVDDAKKVILTPEAGLDPEERWQLETKWIMEMISPLPDGLLLDYGCGVGRITKQVSNLMPVVGVDVSPQMRRLAYEYTDKLLFTAMDPRCFLQLVAHGLHVETALAFWCLQHADDPEFDVRLIADSLLGGRILHVLNRDHRCVPMRGPAGHRSWVDDAVDVDAILIRYFKPLRRVEVPRELCDQGAFFTTWQRTNAEVDWEGILIPEMRKVQVNPWHSSST